MKIKEVEEQLGISAKNIRFYEEAGLIKVPRNKNNHYREFDEATIERLQVIRLLRTLGCTLEQIRQYLHKDLTLAQLMEQRLSQMDQQHELLKQQRKVCETLQKSNTPLIPSIMDEYHQEVIDHRAKENVPLLGKRRIKFRIAANGYVYGLVCGMLCYALLNEVMSVLLKANWLPLAYEGIYGIIAIVIACYLGLQFAIYLPLYTNITLQQYFLLGEHELFYLNEERDISKRQLVKALRKGEVKDVFDTLAYEDIDTLKPGIRVMGASGITASKVYAVTFTFTSKQDEMITCSFGIFQENQEAIELFVKTMQYMAKTIIDPYHILDALQLERHACYERLDEIYEERKKQLVEGHHNNSLWD